MTEAFIYDALRTPRGRGKKGGALYGVKPISLVSDLLLALMERNPDLDPARIEDVVLGIVSPVGEQGGVLPRAAAVAAGMELTGAGLQVDRFCASGLEATNLAAQKVRSGWEHLVVAGGVESMSRVPMGSDGGAWVLDPETNYDSYFVPQGISADLIATVDGFSREDVDSFALSSQDRAAKAWAGGHFSRSIVPVKDRNGRMVLDRDEHMRPEATAESLGGLKPAFETIGEMGGFDAVALQKYHWLERINHVHTAGNSSGIVDGAALLLVGSEQIGTELGLTPRARVVATATVATEPTIMLTGPAPATQKALASAGLTTDDIDLFEVNEAFSAVVLRFAQQTGVEMDRINVNGGAIAMGHPLGATGAMILGTLVDELERRNARRGVATLCIGGGMGVATIVERV